MKELRPRGMLAPSGVRLPASLRGRRNIAVPAARETINNRPEVMADATGDRLSARAAVQPAISPLSLLILSWMHRRNAPGTPSTDGTKAN